jgi:hypothetical protein
VIDLEKKAPKINENRSLIDNIKEKMERMDTDIDKNRSDIFVNRNNIEHNISIIQELSRKVSDKVSCETFDRDFNYLKTLLLHLRK